MLRKHAWVLVSPSLPTFPYFIMLTTRGSIFAPRFGILLYLIIVSSTVSAGGGFIKKCCPRGWEEIV